MAKKEVKKFEFSKVGTILDNIAKNVPILIDKEYREKVYISTGSYILNAGLSGSIFGGISDMGISVFAGPEASGKTFIALNIIREAQKSGYCVVYIDTEYAIHRTDLHKYGIDDSPEKFIIIRGNKVEDITITTTQLIDDLKKAKLDDYEMPKQIWVLDSLAQMASNKMKDDLLDGKITVDMTKAKAIGALFISITADLNYLEIPLIVNNQTYDTMEMFSKTIMKGGRQLYYAANNIVFLSKAKLKEDTDEMDIGQSGIIVTAKNVKNRNVKPKQIKFEISFEKGMNPYKGLEVFCTPENFERIGIAQGKMDLDKSTGEMIFKGGGTKWYVKHLDKSFFFKQLFNGSIFTKDVLNNIEPIVNEYFKYKSIEEMEETEKEFFNNADSENEESDITTLFDE